MNIDPATMDLITKLAAAFVLGTFGGSLRGTLGLLKLRKENKGTWEGLDVVHLALSIATSGAVGILVFLLLDTVDPRAIIPFGYLGVDAIEGLMGEKIKQLKERKK